MDLGKYVPAAFAQQFATQLPAQGPMAYPLPPIPEKMEGGSEQLERLAAMRGDDVIDGGTVRTSDPFQMMHPVSEIGREYAESWERFQSSGVVPLAEAQTDALTESGAIDVDDLLLQVAPDRDKVERLARLVGTLRYALDGHDDTLAGETEGEMRRIGRHLGDKYRIDELIGAARSPNPADGALAALFVERCYRLVEEDYSAMPSLERKIEALQQPPAANA